MSASVAVSHLSSIGVTLCGIDFDLTLVDQHTGGSWVGTDINELADKVRPFFREFIPAAQAKGLQVAIVTFSPQILVVRQVLTAVFGSACSDQILIRGNDGSWECIGGIKSGKMNHLESVMLNLRERYASSGTEFSASTVVLIDDDVNNINVARKYGVRAVVCDPLRPETMTTDILALK